MKPRRLPMNLGPAGLGVWRVACGVWRSADPPHRGGEREASWSAAAPLPPSYTDPADQGRESDTQPTGSWAAGVAPTPKFFSTNLNHPDRGTSRPAATKASATVRSGSRLAGDSPRTRRLLIHRATRTVLGLLALSLLANPLSAFARAGGGGGYSGGGGGFGGGGGGGMSMSWGRSPHGGGGSGIQLPWWGNVLLVAGIAIVSWYLRSQERQSGSSGPPAEPVNLDAREARRDHEAALARLRERDAGFALDPFRARFAEAFARIQEAWQRQAMEPVQHFVSDGIYERFTLQIQEQQALGYRDQLQDLRILQILLAEFVEDQSFETLTVRVVASAIDFRVSLETGRHVSGSTSPQTFVELWSFIRRRGVLTAPNRPSLLEGHCPNCSQPLRLNQMSKCSACGALLRNGDHDWVLAEITQACEWHPRGPDEEAQARDYQTHHDPGFSLQHLEDRASVIFWRKAMADRLGNVKPLLKMATPTLCDHYREGYRRAATEGPRRYAGGCSVGSVAFRGRVADEHFDYALTEIRWSAHTHVVAERGEVRDLGHWRRFKSLYVLARRKGVTTNTSRTIESAHCPSCGAPESDLESHACDACGTVLNTGEHDWVLVDCQVAHSPGAEGWFAKRTPPALTQSEPPRLEELPGEEVSDADVLAWMVSVLAADRKVHPDERALIHQLARKRHVSDAAVEGLIESALAGELHLPTPPNAAVARLWLERLVQIALADGIVQPAELDILKHLGQSLGWSYADINLLINKHRSGNTTRRQRSVRLV